MTNPPPQPKSTPPASGQNSGFDAATASFRTLRPVPPLPPFDFPPSLLPSPLPPAVSAIICATSGVALSYPQLADQARRLAAALRPSVPNFSVALVLSPNLIQLPPLLLALLSLGAVVSPANPSLTPSELARLVRLSNPSVAFATAEAAAKLPPHLNSVVIDSSSFQRLLTADPAGDPAIPPDLRQPETAVVLYSSGTTGRTKAAAISRRSFVARLETFRAEAAERRRCWPELAPAVTVLGSPAFHAMGFFALIKGLVLGETTVVMGGGRGAMEIVRAAERFGATEMVTAPPVVAAMVRPEKTGDFDLLRLRFVFSGGSPLPEKMAGEFKQRFPAVVLCQGYGLTEAGRVAQILSQEESSHIRSVGRLSPFFQAKIVDTVTEKSLLVDEIGELLVKGPTIMTGYVGDDEANSLAFDSSGWLRTGDLCYFDDNGFLYIVGRLKEMIKYKAYQIPPTELEFFIQSLPGVADVAVIPYPDEEVGEIPMACIVREQGHNLTQAQIMDFIGKQVAPYKKIRKVIFVSSIPKSPAGKTLRKELYNQCLNNIYKSKL